jgi:uncharacterized membrane protein YeaQ/YmgE (transglycosylase-associated protein family)
MVQFEVALDFRPSLSYTNTREGSPGDGRDDLGFSTARRVMEQVQSILQMLGGMGVVGTVIIGVLAGIAATIIMPGNDPSGIIVTPLIGIAGAGLATYLGQYLNITIAGQLSGFIAAVIGSILILLAYRMIFRKTG